MLGGGADVEAAMIARDDVRRWVPDLHWQRARRRRKRLDSAMSSCLQRLSQPRPVVKYGNPVPNVERNSAHYDGAGNGY
jgi:hypothetical protein